MQPHTGRIYFSRGNFYLMQAHIRDFTLISSGINYSPIVFGTLVGLTFTSYLDRHIVM